MTDGPRLSALLVLAGLAAGAAAGEDSPMPAAQDDARCAVWARELGFADALARHDATAFAGFLHADAVFGVGHQPTRGRDAIVADWMPLIEGKALELRWYPERVSVGGDGRTAYSSGPALYRIEGRQPSAGPLRIGVATGGRWPVAGDLRRRRTPGAGR